MLFKSNKFFDLKSKKALVKLVIQKLILLGNMFFPCILNIHVKTQVHNCTGSAIFGIAHPKVLWQTYLFPTDITLTLLKLTVTVTSGQVNATKNVTIYMSQCHNIHIHIYMYIYNYVGEK